VRIVRVGGRNVWRLAHLERTPQASLWAAEAEAFLLDGRAAFHLRRAGTTMLAVMDETFIAVAILYRDPVYQECIRLGSLAVDHRHRGGGVGRLLFAAMLTEALLSASYAIWLVHPENDAMLHISRRDPRVSDESVDESGYVVFLADRPPAVGASRAEV
jgi:GNAT superfamily N-acetyltransferase